MLIQNWFNIKVCLGEVKPMKVSQNKIIAAGVVGLLIAPAVAGAITASTNIDAVISSTISMSTSGTVTLNVTPVSGGSQSTQTDTVTVSTNNSIGYLLTLADSDATTTLVKGSDTLAAHTATQASPGALANNSWGYRVSGIGGFTTTNPTPGNNISDSTLYAGMPASGSANTIKSTSTTASNDTTTVYYSVKADSTKPNGTYADVVTYTATVN